MPCWIAPRDIPPGSTYADSIIEGITQSDSLVLILSDHSNLSRHVLAEVERAFSLAKPVFPVRIRDVKPAKGLELFVSGSQWIDALALPLDSKMSQLADAIRNLREQGAAPSVEPARGADVSEERRELSSRLNGVDIVAVAVALMETGATGLEFAPVATFGHMATVDPTEIRQAQAIQAAVRSHMLGQRSRRLLRLAVLGPAGSGKMFPIQQIVRSAGPQVISPIELELATMQDAKELVPAFRQAQDAALRAQTAVLFVLGFDAPLAGVRFGWLQHLVPVMRDSEFLDGGLRRPVGSSVLCLVGTDYLSRSRLIAASGDRGAPSILKSFISMVDGWFDIQGIDPLWPGDRVHVLTRALLLRAALRHLRRRLAPELLRALLTAPHYANGAHSLVAIIEASQPVEDGSLLTRDSLPTEAVLTLHTDAGWLLQTLKERSA